MSQHADIVRLAHARGYRVTDDGKLLSPSGDERRGYYGKRDYLKSTVSIGGVSKHYSVHKLAAYQKFGDAALADGVHVRHLDNNARNNSAANIAIGSASDNQMDFPVEFRMRRTRLGTAITRKLTREQALDVVRRFEKGTNPSKRGNSMVLAREFGVSRGTILNIIKGNYYAAITGIARQEPKVRRVSGAEDRAAVENWILRTIGSGCRRAQLATSQYSHHAIWVALRRLQNRGAVTVSRSGFWQRVTSESEAAA